MCYLHSYYVYIFGIQNFDYLNLNIDIKGLKNKKNEEEKTERRKR